jgi:hypothetical protein
MSKHNKFDEEQMIVENVIAELESNPKEFEDILIGRFQRLVDIITYYYGKEVSESGSAVDAVECPKILDGMVESVFEKFFMSIRKDIEFVIKEKEEHYKFIKEKNDGE